MINSVLSRPMFNQSQTDQSVAPTSSGIGGMTTPDQNAQALKKMFAPQIPVTPPTQSFPVPQAGYKRGGEVIDGVAHFADGNEVVVPPAEPGAGTKLAAAAYDVATLPYQFLSGWFGGKRMSLTPAYDEYVRKQSGETGEAPVSPAQVAGATTKDVLSSPVRGAQYVGNVVDPKEVSPVQSFTPTRDIYRAEEEAQRKKGVEERLRAATRAALEAPVIGTSFQEEAAGSGILKVAPKPPGEMSLELESIRARREQAEARFASRKEESIKQREENKWMGILAAGLGMMAGKDRNALVNIGAGGQQGLATFAGLEKGRREEESTARREDLMRDQLAQQKEIAFAQLAKDPETVRTYAALGGWKAGDPPEKFKEAVLRGAEAQQLKTRASALEEYLKAARDPLSGITPEKAQRAQEELLRIGMAGGSGSGQFPGFKDVSAK